MPPADDHNRPKPRPGPIRWLSAPLRAAVEETASACEGRPWRIACETDLSEFACHPCAIVSDGSLAVFFKYNQAVDAHRQFEIELSALRFLSEATGVLVPRPLGIARVESGTLLIMEALEPIARGPRQWRQIGAALARVHRVKGETCGFHRDGFWGPLQQDNTPARDWVAFSGERRLGPLLKIAVDSGNLPASVAAQTQRLLGRLPELCGPEVEPSLLHGDPQQNNFISTARGAFVIDPAVYYGDPEMDLAALGCWQPVPDIVYDGYREEMPIDSGFFERCNLWRVPFYLAGVALEGSMYLERLAEALDTYS